MARPTTPLIAVDTIIELQDQPEKPIVLIKRKYPPPGWAIPGGFVDEGESMESAAVREALEETCLQVSLQTLLGCYSDPARDPRGYTVSAIYIATASGIPKARDDAADIKVCTINNLPQPLAFDHADILRDYFRYRELGILPAPAKIE